MFNISKFLGKFSKDVDSREVYVEKIREIIKKETGLSIETNNIEIKDYVVCLKSTPAFLNKIFINKKNIIEIISSELPIKIVDIK